MPDTRMGVGYLQTINSKKQWVLDTGQVLNFTQPPPPPGLSFGVDIAGNDGRGYSKAQDYTLVTNALGRDLHNRLKFFGGGSGTIQDSVDNQTSTGSNEPIPVMCFKAFTSAQLNTYLDNLTERVQWVWYQEFQPGDGGQTWAQWNNNVAAIKNIRDNHPNGHFVEMQAVNSSAYFRKPTTPANDWQNIDYTLFDCAGWDTYMTNPIRTPSALLDNQIAAFNYGLTQNPSLRWNISEWGITRLKQVGSTTVLMDPNERVGYMQAQLDYMIANGCSGVNYWAVDNTPENVFHDYSIDKAGDAIPLNWVLTQLNTYTATY